jgi:hypothetical protein
MPLAPSSGGGSTQDLFWTQVLIDMGAPVTQANIQGLNAWSEREGGGGRWNPLNTTRPAPGSSSFNSVGVQNYPSMAVGAQATADSIRNGRYPSIVAAFQSGSAFQMLVSGGQGSIGQQLRTWSGGGYNNVNFGSSGYSSPAFGGSGGGAGGSLSSNSSANAVGGATTGACNTLAQSISNAGGGVASAVPGEQQIAGFFGWITQGCVQKRLLIQGVSALLILYGMKFMGHSEPLKIVTAPVKAGAAFAA